LAFFVAFFLVAMRHLLVACAANRGALETRALKRITLRPK
jgi:hypothetical protein